MSTTSKGNAPSERQSAGKEAKWWCNFCDFRTDDQKEYLSHSCAGVLKQRQQGEGTAAGGKNA